MTTLCSLGTKSLTLIYDYLPAKERKTFPKVCRTLNSVALYHSKIEKVFAFIQENYEYCFGDAKKKPQNPKALLYVDIFLLGENHLASFHRRINSDFLNLTYVLGIFETYTEFETIQIPYADRVIKEKTQCWDTSKDFLAPSGRFLIAACTICEAYLECCQEYSFNFLKFLASYINEKKKLLSATECNGIAGLPSQFYLTIHVESLCKTYASWPEGWKRGKNDLLNILLSEMVEHSDYYIRRLDNENIQRNENFRKVALVSIKQGKIPIFVGGHAHTHNKVTHAFFKENGINFAELYPIQKTLKKSEKGDEVIKFESLSQVLQNTENPFTKFYTIISSPNLSDDKLKTLKADIDELKSLIRSKAPLAANTLDINELLIFAACYALVYLYDRLE